MPRYFYRAKSFKGQEKKGVIEAKDEYDLARVLRKEGYLLVSFKLREKKKRKKLFLFRRVPLSQKLMFTRNLGVMISAGVSLPRALSILGLQTKNKHLKKAIKEIREEVLRGENLSGAIKNHPKIFSDLFCSMIEVGEKTGGLEKVLKILATHLERDYKLRSKVRGAMVYPSVICGVTVVVIILMLIKVVPRLSQTFEELNLELPKMTKFVINFGSFLGANWYFVFLALFLFPLLFLAAIRTKEGKRRLDFLLLKIPFVSGLIKKINSAYTSRTLSSLIAGGVSIVEALRITSNSVGNFYFKKAILEAAKKVQKGKKLSQTLLDYKNLYSLLFIQMVEVGEETGQTSEVLEKLADFFEDEVTNITQNLSSIIEPILLLLIGGVVGFFAVSMIQPIYSMMGAL
jgi:type IV pilus assembly protein PilC